eukprot:Tbor_TRINITY_DN4901_c0_g1::TRINITY_DN4901_c0_g1_i1::g.9976::m.9976
MKFELIKSVQEVVSPSPAYGCPAPEAFSNIVVKGAAAFTTLQEERMAHECSDPYVHSGSKMKGSSFKPYMMRHAEAYLPFHLSLTEGNSRGNTTINSRVSSISALVMGTLVRLEDSAGKGDAPSAVDDGESLDIDWDGPPGNGSVHFLFWFLECNDIPLSTMDAAFDQIQIDSTIMMGELVSFAGLIWASFVRGQCHWTVKLMDALLIRMRRELTFTADEEREFSSIIGFLIEIISLREGNLSHHMFLRWQSQAVRAVESARSVLAPRVEDDERVVLIKCDIFMKILLVCSGDPQCLKEIHSITLDPVEVMCGICSVVKPFMSMRELQQQIRIVFGNVDNNWYHEVVLGLFTSTTFFDVVTVMEALSDAASMMLRQANSSVLLSGSDDLDTVEYDERMEALSLLYIAAHTSDICAPPFAAGQSKKNQAMSAVHQRNKITREYVLAITPDTTFLFRRPLLDAALSYIAWSPLIDVEVLPRVLAPSLMSGSPCITVAAGELTTLFQTMFGSRSAIHQPRLRTIVNNKIGNDPLLGQIWAFQDNFCDLVLRNAITNTVKHYLHDTHEYSVALGELAHYQKTVSSQLSDDALQLFKSELRNIIKSPKGCDMLANPFIIQIGECVNIGAVIVKECFDDIEMRKLIRVCSCLAEIMVWGDPIASHFMEDFTVNNTKHMSSSASSSAVSVHASKFPIKTTFPSHLTTISQSTAAMVRGTTRLVEHCIEYLNDDVKLAVSTLMGAILEICALHPEVSAVALSDLNAPSSPKGLGPFISFKQKVIGLMMEIVALTNSLYMKAPNETEEETKAKLALMFRVVNKDYEV